MTLEERQVRVDTNAMLNSRLSREDSTRQLRRQRPTHLVILVLLLAQLTAAQDNASQHQDLFVTANVQFTLCHELTHALISTFDIPVLGQEEAAADQISTLCVLYPESTDHRDPQATEKLVAVADAWRLEWELDKESGGAAYWDEHALDIQRYYNVLCMLYGSDTERFEDLPDKLDLPWQRAWTCADHEYDRTVKAGQWLLETFGLPGDGTASRRGNQVRVIYDDPPESKRRAHEVLIESAVFEHKSLLMNSIFDLPDSITIVATDCLGDATAYWTENRREVVFCYDLVERFIHLAEIRQCILGRHVAFGDRQPMEPDKIALCLTGER